MSAGEVKLSLSILPSMCKTSPGRFFFFFFFFFFYYWDHEETLMASLLKDCDTTRICGNV